MYIRGPLVATNFQSFSYKSNKNKGIFLKFSAFVHHMSVQIWQKNFGHYSNSLPATVHFGHNFECLLRVYLFRHSKEYEHKQMEVMLTNIWSISSFWIGNNRGIRVQTKTVGPFKIWHISNTRFFQNRKIIFLLIG